MLGKHSTQSCGEWIDLELWQLPHKIIYRNSKLGIIDALGCVQFFFVRKESGKPVKFVSENGFKSTLYLALPFVAFLYFFL